MSEEVPDSDVLVWQTGNIFFQGILLVQFSFFLQHHDDHGRKLFRYRRQFEDRRGVHRLLRIKIPVTECLGINRRAAISHQDDPAEIFYGSKQ